MANRKFKGPVRPGESEERFRETGETKRKFRGPVRPGTDKEKFRRSGSSGGGAVSPRPVAGPTRADLEAEQKRKKKLSDLAEQKKRAEEKRQRDMSQARKENIERRKKKVRFETVTRAEESRKSRISKIFQQLQDLQKKKSTSSIRNKQKNLKNELELFGVTVAVSVITGAIALVTLPKTLLDVAKDPTMLKGVPSAIARSGKQFGQLIRVSPTEAFAKIGGEIVLLKGTGSSLRVVGKVTGNVATRLNPKFKRIKKGEINLKTTGGKTTIRVGGTVKQIQEPLKKQVSQAGKRVTAVSAQADAIKADKIIDFIKSRRVIRKPIPGEEKFGRSTKALLRKFDSGRITRQQLIRLQKKVPLLERSFFADPSGRFRPSRLGAKQKDATLLDLLAGDVTFRSPKPQILVFENVKVSKFPKALKSIQTKLRKGKTLTREEGLKLERFQLKKSGEFKPVGALSKEPEITLAPGEIIKKVRKVGVTIINGKRVSIVQVKVVKPTKTTQRLIKKARSGKITARELNTLRKNLKKETGFKSKVSSRRTSRARPRARIPKRGIRRRAAKRPVPRTPRRGLPRRPTPRTPRRGLPRRPTPRTPRRGLPRRPTPRTPRRGPPRRSIVGKPPVIARVPKLRRLKKKRKKKKTIGFNVFARPVKKRKGQKKPRLIKINKVSLTKKRAEDLRDHVLDTSLARTGKIKPAKGKPEKPGLKVPAGFSKRNSKKFRKFRVVKGKRKKLPRGRVIEKRRHILDTRQEKNKISLRRRLRQITPKRKKGIKRRYKK